MDEDERDHPRPPDGDPGRFTADPLRVRGSRPVRRDASRRSWAADAPSLRLRCAEDLIEAVPYLLGFHPRDSLVLVGLAPLPGPPPRRIPGLGRVQITARMDIADLCSDPPAAGGSSTAGDLTASHFAVDDVTAGHFAVGDVTADNFAVGAAEALRRAGARSAVGLVFPEGPAQAERCVQAMARAGSACERVGVDVVDWLVVPPDTEKEESASRGGVHSGPWGPAMSEQDSAQIESVPRCGAVAAEATYAGLVAWPERDDVVRLLDPVPTASRERLRPALVAAESGQARGVRTGGGVRQRRSAIRNLFAASRTLAVVTDPQLIAHGVALSDIEVRDACWLAMERGRLDGQELWREMARRLPEPYDAAPLFLFGWLRWRAGDGVLAGIAARRALDSDPGYRAAHLLDGALRTGLDPFRTPRLRKGA